MFTTKLTPIEQWRLEAPRLQAESQKKRQEEHEKFISYTPVKQARLKLRALIHKYNESNYPSLQHLNLSGLDLKCVDLFAKHFARELKDVKKPQLYVNTNFFKQPIDFGNFKLDEADIFEKGGLIEFTRDRNYKLTDVGQFLASALYASPPDYTKTIAKAAEREKIKEERRKQKLIEKKVGRVYLNVPYIKRGLAKMHGAKWDKDLKMWYLPKFVEVHEELLVYVR